MLNLLCFNCDIMFPSPTLAKADGGAEHGEHTLLALFDRRKVGG